MATKSTAPVAKTTFIFDGEKQELEEYIKNGGETFERYKFTENYIQNFALLKTFYSSAAN